MESRGRWWLTVAVVSAVWWWRLVRSQSQTNLLNQGCSQYNVTDGAEFIRNQNATFSHLRNQLGSGGGSWFATAHAGSVYGMAQCRNYMSRRNCLACYDAAVLQILKCSTANGARVIYDGCFLRYEGNNFYNDTTLPGNSQICSNHTAPGRAAFSVEGGRFLSDLQIATPRINGYFAAAKHQMPNGGNLSIYGVAQCAETISQSGCLHCLTVALGNINSCLPNTDGRAFDAACFLRYSGTPFFADNQTIDITPFLGEQGNSNKKKAAIIGGAVGGVGLIILILLGWYKFSRKPKRAARDDILGATELQGPNIYKYKDLKAATNNFSEENKLGEGGFGDVYKATLRNGSIVAVKKLDINYKRAKIDFETEVRLISNVHHRNLVRLLGCCSTKSELLLVYEYMANGSLDRFLYAGDKRRAVLTWKQRFDIILGMAKGLAYLHEQYHVCIIHRDIKPANILLDNEFQPKIADFGLARLLPQDQTHVSTKFAGTLGYTPPEYAIHGHLSEKVDTYSFGVVILEIVSGRRSGDMNADSDTTTEYLLENAWKLYDVDMHEKLGDDEAVEAAVEDVKKMVEIGLICTQSPPSSRPTMSEILVMLLSSGPVPVQPQPRGRPILTYGNDYRFVSETTSSSTEVTNNKSHATASFTDFTGR